MFISKEYSQKLWTNHERRSAQARAFIENREYILPARFDDTEVPGLPPTVGYISLKELSPSNFASIIKSKLEASAEEQARSKTNNANSLHTTSSPLERLQTYLVEDRYRIALYQLVVDQRETLVAQLAEDEFPLKGASSIEDIQARMKKYEALVLPTIDFFITGCRWGLPAQVDNWTEFIERVANSNGRRFGEYNRVLVNLRLYPALLLTYATGIVCISSNRFDTLKSIFTSKVIDRNTGEDAPLALMLNRNEILDKDIMDRFPGLERKYTPASEYLFELLKSPLAKHLADDRRYEIYFDRFEYFMATVHADLRDKEYTRQYGNDGPRFGPKFWGPIGRFGWKRMMHTKPLFQDLVKEATEQGAKWPPLAAGLFGGSLDRFLEVHNGLMELVSKLGWY